MRREKAYMAARNGSSSSSTSTTVLVSLGACPMTLSTRFSVCTKVSIASRIDPSNPALRRSTVTSTGGGRLSPNARMDRRGSLSTMLYVFE